MNSPASLVLCATATVVIFCSMRTSALAQSGDPLAQNPSTGEASLTSVTGYADKLSVQPGDTLTFMISTSAASLSAAIIRFGMAVDTLMNLSSIAAFEQAVPDSSYHYGCGWKPTFRIVVTENFRSGMYSAFLRDANNTTSYITFIVKPSIRGIEPLAVVASTNTWNAYNNWGGKSLYVPDPGYAKFLSLLRPNPRGAPIFTGREHLASAEGLILAWLERNGYRYDLFTDIDLHKDSTVLDAYRTVVLNTHPEYYSGQMIDCLKHFLAIGGNLLYLGGNGAYWKVTFDSTCMVMECRKDGSVHSQTGEQGGLWRNLGRPEAAFLGVRYTGVGGNTFAPYRVLAGSHWTFQGTGLETDALFGFEGVNGGAASGWETDKIDPSTSPKQIVVLARGTNLNGGGADMAYYDHPGGGFVFSVGSISYGGALARDQSMGLMLKNVLRGRPTNVTGPGERGPVAFQLEQNYPNPFNPTTTISFSLPTSERSTLKVFDVLGREVSILVHGEKTAGTHRAVFDGSRLPSGVYIVTFQAGRFQQSRMMMLVR